MKDEPIQLSALDNCLSRLEMGLSRSHDLSYSIWNGLNRIKDVRQPEVMTNAAPSPPQLGPIDAIERFERLLNSLDALEVGMSSSLNHLNSII